MVISLIVQILGKVHRYGKSKKTGNDYDFTEIHFTVKLRGVDGVACRTALISSDVISSDRILLNQHYDLETDLDGHIVAVRSAKA